MSLLRWIPTFLAFPLGGLVATALFGPMSNPLIALGGGLVVGLSIGGAQWLALGRTVGWRWPVATAIASMLGLALGVLLIGAPVAMPSAVAVGAISGLTVGAGQGAVLRRGIRVGALWAGVVGGAWALGWFLTALVIVDLDRGYAVFGASGAIAATLTTGVVLRTLLGRRVRRPQAETSAAAEAAQA